MQDKNRASSNLVEQKITMRTNLNFASLFGVQIKVEQVQIVADGRNFREWILKFLSLKISQVE